MTSYEAQHALISLLRHNFMDTLDSVTFFAPSWQAYNELWSTCQRRLVEEMNSPVNLGIVPVKVNINLTSPFNAATAMGSRIDNEEQHSENMTNLGPPKDGLPKMGQGPAGMASVAPF